MGPHAVPFLAVDPLAILGCSVKIPDNMSTLIVAVVSFDDAPQPSVGQAVVQAAEMQET